MTGPRTLEAGPAHTVDAFLGGRVMLMQPTRGHRAGLDAALLQALVPRDAKGHAVDLGTGVGTVALSLAARVPAIGVTGVERDPSLVALAQESLRRPENASFTGRVTVVEADVTALGNLDYPSLAERSADWVLMNPPWDAPGRVRPSPDPARRAAHLAGPGDLDAWVRGAMRLLKSGASLGLIHRSRHLPELLGVLAGRFGNITILPVHPAADAAATRILIRATKGSRAGVQLLPGLILHEPGGAWTSRAETILRGAASLAI